MSDLISRQAAIDALKNRQDDGKGDISRFYNTIIQYDIEAIKQLPPAQPKRGKWIHISEGMWKCDQCGEISCCSPNFCPDCGADMRGEQDE